VPIGIWRWGAVARADVDLGASSVELSAAGSSELEQPALAITTSNPIRSALNRSEHNLVPHGPEVRRFSVRIV
jgi:hypothetical protein